MGRYIQKKNILKESMEINVYEDIIPWLNDVVKYFQKRSSTISFVENIDYLYASDFDNIIKGSAYYFEADNIKWVISKSFFEMSLKKHKSNNPFIFKVLKDLDLELKYDGGNLEEFIDSIKD